MDDRYRFRTLVFCLDTYWYTGHLFTEMLKKFDTSGLPDRHADPRAPCAMLVDNAGSHTIDATQSELSCFTKIIPLPPNTTALMQPNDQGIISAFKAVYRREFMDIVNTRIESKITALKAAGTPIPHTLAAEVFNILSPMMMLIYIIYLGCL